MSYMSDKEQVDMLKKFWHEYGRFIAIAIIIGLATGFGWNAWQKHQRLKIVKAASLYSQALTQKSEQADAHLLELLTIDYPSSSYRALAAFRVAHDYLIEGKAQQAADSLQALIDSPVNKAFKKLAKIRLATVYLYLKQPQKSLAIAKALDESANSIERLQCQLIQIAAYDQMGETSKKQNTIKQASASWTSLSKGRLPLPEWLK